MTRERPLRALVLTNMYPTTERPDLGSVVREQVRELAALGVRSEIVAIRGQQSKAAYVNVARSLPLLVRRRDFDLVHAHYGLSGAVALAQRRLPVITTFHGSDTGYVPWQGAVSWIVARVTTPVFVSRRGAERLGLRGTGPNIIPCGVDIGRFQPMSRARARAALGWDHDAPIALLPGARENAVKRADLFESAAAEARSSVPDLRDRVARELHTRRGSTRLECSRRDRDDLGLRGLPSHDQGIAGLRDTRGLGGRRGRARRGLWAPGLLRRLP